MLNIINKLLFFKIRFELYKSIFRCFRIVYSFNTFDKVINTEAEMVKKKAIIKIMMFRLPVISF